MRTRLSRAAHTSIFKLCLLLLIGLAPVAVQALGVRMVSVDAAGSAAGQATTGGGLQHKDASMSADASKVLYSSLADNLTSPLADNDDELGDPNNVFDVFVWERSSGDNSMVALNLDGNSSGDGAGILGHISADGTHVAFINDSTNLAVDQPNPIPTPTPDGDDHVYLLSGGDLNFLTLNYDASSPAGGNPGAAEVQVGNNGKVFFTWASFNLIDDKVICDRNGSNDLFVYDAASSSDNKIELLSISQNPDFSDMSCDPGATDKTANSGISDIMVDSGGNKVVFVSSANDLISPQIETDSDDDIFVWDNGTIKMVSKNATGDDGGNGQSINPIISSDGLTVVFESNATDLVAGISDGNGSSDVFVWTEALGVRLVSVNETGLATGNAGATNPSVSGNGILVVFESNASDLTDTDNQSSTQIYLRNVLNNTTEMVSLKANPTDPMVPEGSSGGALNPLISDDGSTVAFKSVAADLTGGTVSGSLTQIYVRDLALGVNQLLTPGTTGEGGNGASHPIQISSDGRYVLLSSAATDLDSNVTDVGITADDLFLAEQLGFVEFDAAEYEITEGDSGNVQVTVTVNRLKAGDSEASVAYKTDDADPETTATAGVDYTSATGTLTWSAGETGPKQFDIAVAGDAGAEADEFIRIVLENPAGTSIGNQGSAKIKIVNDDEDCGNGVNDDPGEDTDVDCADSDCDSDPSCQESGNCGDTIDNDQDTQVDCDDSDCTGDPACSEICDDGTDNDNDTLADCDDPDCSLAPNCLNPEVCNNALDDDNDTLVDCLDVTDCAADPACTDPSGDGDGDGFINSSDNCPLDSNPGQEDTDGDGTGNECDTTEDDCGNNQNDDGDGLSDCGDPDCAASNECVDSDSDAIVNADDNCPNANNPGQEDTDGDGTGNACDAAEGSCSNGVSDDTDADVDCDDTDCAADPACAAPGDDDDGDGVLNATDNCPSVANPGQENTDGDGLGNACDDSEGDCDNGVTDDTDALVDCADVTDALVDCADPDCAAAANCLDDDSDGVPNIADNCDNVANPGQEDGDGDGFGNACDGSEGLCNNGASDDTDGDVDCADADCAADPVCTNPGGDDDGDGVPNASDNCPADANPGQENGDGDGFGDVCDNSEGDCGNGLNDDIDGDVDCADSECSATPNCVDDDGDGVPNVFDNCPNDFNDTQDDFDFDGIGDACDAFPIDFDNDGVDDFSDNCFDVPNPGQEETDGDFIGNACDPSEGNCVNGGDDDNDALVDCQDSDCSAAQACAALPDDDGDGIPNVTDNCPSDANADQADTDGDGAGNACDANPDLPEDDDGDGPGTGPTIPPGSQPAGGGGLGCSLNGAAANHGIPTLYAGIGALAIWALRWRRGRKI